jgi:hypothetical protein
MLPYLLDLSGRYIRASSVPLTGEIGERLTGLDGIPFDFFLHDDGREMKRYVGEGLEEITTDTNQHVHFVDLASYLHRINDPQAAVVLFKHVFDEIFERAPILKQSELYICLPYPFPGHLRPCIRQVFQRFSKLRFRGFLSDLLCGAYYLYLNELEELSDEKTGLLMLSFLTSGLRSAYFTLHQEGDVDILCVDDVKNHPDRPVSVAAIQKRVADLAHPLKSREDLKSIYAYQLVEENKKIYHSYAKALNSQNLTLLPEMGNGSSIVEIGAKALIHRFKGLDGQRPLKIEFDVSIHVLLGGTVHCLIDRAATLPIERRQAFRLCQTSEGFTVSLTCGGSLELVSQTLLSSFEVRPDSGQIFSEGFDFVVGVDLRDRLHGTMQIYLPDGKVLQKAFRVPLIQE